MIAHIIPLTRLPSRFSFFDYRIPEGITVDIGDLVQIPFRGIRISGIVQSLAETSEQKKLAQVEKVIERARLTKTDLNRLERIATHLGQSSASVLLSALPKFFSQSKEIPPHKANASPALSKEEATRLKEMGIFLKEHPTCALQGDTETGIALAHLIAKQLAPNEQLLVLVPRDRDAHIVAQFIPHKSLAVLTGTTPEKERDILFHAWKSGALNVLIGTKQAALWSAPNLARILVLQAGNDEYANLRRNPKFDPREAAKLLAATMHASYVSIDTLPRIEDCKDAPRRTEKLPTTPLIVSLKDRQEKTAYPLITTSLVKAIKNASQSQKKVLLFLNRKGAAKRLQCTACDQVPLCGTCGNLPTVRAHDLICDRCGTEMWIPKECPLCGKPKLKFVGVGGEKVVADLQELFPELSLGLVEKGNDSAWKTANVIVGTEHVFANLLTPFTRYGFGLIADLMADLPVGGVNFRATENTARQLLRLSSLAEREKASCIMQTWIPERLPELFAPEFIATEELRLRESYKLPPFGTLFTTKTTTLRNPETQPSEPFTYDGPYT